MPQRSRMRDRCARLELDAVFHASLRRQLSGQLVREHIRELLQQCRGSWVLLRRVVLGRWPADDDVRLDDFAATMSLAQALDTECGEVGSALRVHL